MTDWKPTELIHYSAFLALASLAWALWNDLRGLALIIKCQSVRLYRQTAAKVTGSSYPMIKKHPATICKEYFEATVNVCDANGLLHLTIAHTHMPTKALAYSHTLAHSTLYSGRLQLVALVKQSRPP